MIERTTPEGSNAAHLKTGRHAGAPKPPAIAISALALVLAIASSSYLLHGVSTPALAATDDTAAPLVEMPSFASLVDKTKPSVVSIYVRVEQNQPTLGWGEQQPNGQPPPNSPFRFFFQPFGGQGFGFPAIPEGPQIVRAQGSGFFISSDGYLVTNNHVIANAKKIEIKTTEGKTYPAKLVGADPKTDLALLKVDAPVEFKYVNFATTLPKVGDWVVAMGNPFGLGGTVTAGIVSAEGRDIGDGPYDDYLQIDAPVNSGNSGGPSFNLKGEVVGINTAIFTPSGGSVGIAFDIPATTAKKITDELKAHGKVERGWIGVTVQPVTEDIAKSLGLKEASGALIDQPQADSPADRAGLKSGDIIESVDGVKVKDSRDLARKIGETAPGTTIQLSVVRSGAERTFELTVKSYPSEAVTQDESPGRSTPSLGMALAPSDQVGDARADGVVVVGVDPTGVAAEKGVQEGDVIVGVGDRPVANPGQLRMAIEEAEKSGKSSILLHMKTAEGDRFVALPLKES